MNKFGNHINIKRLGWISIFFILFTSACVYDKEFAYLNDQIVNLNKRVSGLQDSVDEGLSKKDKDLDSDMQSISSDMQSINSDMQSISSNQSELRLEIDQLRGDIRELSGRIEENEHLLKRTVEKDLNEQEAIMADLNDLSQLTLKVQELEKALLIQQSYLNLDSKADPGTGILITNEKDLKPPESPKSRELDLYNSSYELYKQGNIDEAMDGFNRFLAEFPKSDRADNAQFWIGECLMSMKQHKKAILAYEDVIKKYPKGNKVPNAMLRQAIAFQEINDLTMSRLLLEKVIKEFPATNEAQIAKTKLKKIK